MSGWAAFGQAAAKVAGEVAPALIQYRSAKKDREMQYDAAQNSISWRVQDAKNAGIHPLFALGAPTQNMNPTTVGYSPMDFASAFDMVANSKYNKELQKQTLEKNQLEIDGLKLRNQIAYLQSVKPMRDTMGQSPAPFAPSQIPAKEPETQPRNILEDIYGNPGLYRVGADVRGALQDMLSEGWNAESARHLLMSETSLGEREYQLIADWKNSKRRSKDDPFLMVHKDDFYGPVIVDSRMFDHYYGVNGKRRSLRSKFDDWYNKGKSKFNSKIADYERLVYRKRYGRYMPYGE